MTNASDLPDGLGYALSKELFFYKQGPLGFTCTAAELADYLTDRELLPENRQLPTEINQGTLRTEARSHLDNHPQQAIEALAILEGELASHTYEEGTRFTVDVGRTRLGEPKTLREVADAAYKGTWCTFSRKSYDELVRGWVGDNDFMKLLLHRVHPEYHAAIFPHEEPAQVAKKVAKEVATRRIDPRLGAGIAVVVLVGVGAYVLYSSREEPSVGRTVPVSEQTPEQSLRSVEAAITLLEMKPDSAQKEALQASIDALEERDDVDKEKLATLETQLQAVR
tara:strand:- start:182 stop:1024 length:843 start_codon:yes stop_codon:yes gene_type:complete